MPDEQAADRHPCQESADVHVRLLPVVVDPESSTPLSAGRPERVQEPRARHAGVGAAVHELRGRGRDPGPDAAAEVALDPFGGLVGAAVGFEAIEIEPEALGARPQVGVVQVTLILEQRVVHLPEAPLQARRMSRLGEHARPGVLGDHREVAEHPRDGEPLEDEMRRRAVGALQVGVLDHHRSRAADLIVRPGLRRRCAAPGRRR